MPITADLLNQLHAAEAEVEAAGTDAEAAQASLDTANATLATAQGAANLAQADFAAKKQVLTDKVNALEAIGEQLKN